MKRVDIRPSADADLDDIYEWIARDDPQAAERTVERIVDAAKRLRHFPDSGTSRPELGPQARSIVIGKYLVLYRVGSDSVDILRVVHGARDLGGMLDEVEEE